ARLDDPGRPPMAEHHRSRTEDRAPECRAPVGAAWIDRDPPDDRVDQAVQEVFLATDMRVERHRLDAQLLAEPAHADRVDALVICEVERSRQHPGAAEWRPALLALVPRLDALQKTLLTPLRRTVTLRRTDRALR